jgi:hypothetical protein
VTSHSGLRPIAERACRDVGPGVDTPIVAGGEVRGVPPTARCGAGSSPRAASPHRLSVPAPSCSPRRVCRWQARDDWRVAGVSGAPISADHQADPTRSSCATGRSGLVGVTAGIDMALAMVAEDLGHALALRSAAW